MKKLYFFLWLYIISCSAYSGTAPEKDWGIAAGFRSAGIPYPAKENRVQDFIPLLFYNGDTFFVRGLTGGIKFYDKDSWQFSLIGRYRFFDIPAEFQNLTQGNALDIGGQLKYRINDETESDFEIMSDDEGRYYTSVDVRYQWQSGDWELFPYATLRYKSSAFNDHYFGLDGFSDPKQPSQVLSNKIGGGFDLTIGSEIRYHVISNLYLLGRAQIMTLDSKTRDSITVQDGTYGEVYLGLAFFNDRTRKKSPALKAKPYVRVSQGWATPSNFGDILHLDWEDDEQDNQMTSVFYGHPISDSLFGVEAFDIYLTTGFAYHHRADPYQQTLAAGKGINSVALSGVEGNPCDGKSDCTISYDLQPAREYVIGIKAYYNIHWPVHWRFGLAEGLSYIETVSNIEQREMDRKGYRASNLMNYIDLTFDFNLGDAFGVAEMRGIFLGVGIHHRSSIFETSSAFGRIKGGSNYNTVYLQYHF